MAIPAFDRRVRLAGLHVLALVEEMNGDIGVGRAYVVATGLEGMRWEDGSVLGLASAIYLLPPAPESAEESVPKLVA